MQGYFNLLQIPHTSCDMYQANVTFNKRDCLSILKPYGILCAESYYLNEGDEIILSTDKGKVIRCAVKEIRTAGRNTQGVRIFKLSGDEKVVSAIKIEDNFN